MRNSGEIFIWSIIIGLFVSIIVCVFLGCSENRNKEPETFKVEKFEIADTVSASMHVVRYRQTKKTYIYDMVLTDRNQNTFNLKFVSDENLRFFPGDSIYYWFDSWKLKQ